MTDPARGGPQVIPRPPASRPGGPPPWADLIGTDPAVTPADIRDALGGLDVDRSMGLVGAGLRRSAVAAILSTTTGPAGPSFEVLLTRRAWTMRTHRGEVSFPGGAEDPGDDFPTGTALREACEEVQFDPSSAEVVGALDPLTTFTSDRVVVPVVLVTPERPTVVASPAEVDAILHVSLADLLHPDTYHSELWSWDEAFERVPGGVPARTDHPMHFYDLPGDTVWGATAAMLTQLLAALLAR